MRQLEHVGSIWAHKWYTDASHFNDATSTLGVECDPLGSTTSMYSLEFLSHGISIFAFRTETSVEQKDVIKVRSSVTHCEESSRKLVENLNHRR